MPLQDCVCTSLRAQRAEAILDGTDGLDRFAWFGSFYHFTGTVIFFPKRLW
jgi:hypothetical protein